MTNINIIVQKPRNYIRGNTTLDPIGNTNCSKPEEGKYEEGRFPGTSTHESILSSDIEIFQSPHIYKGSIYGNPTNP